MQLDLDSPKREPEWPQPNAGVNLWALIVDPRASRKLQSGRTLRRLPLSPKPYTEPCPDSVEDDHAVADQVPYMDTTILA